MLRLGSAVLMICAAACGSAAAASASRSADVIADAEHVEDVDDVVYLNERLPAIQAGSYRLRLSAECQRRELTATGTLTLKPIAGSEPRATVAESDAVLLWGQADLDLEKLSSCLGGSVATSSEPIHPSVLVEVLRWDGEPQHPVLLVSTEGPRRGARRRDAVGIAMWVERIDSGHMSGVWSRWEIMGREEGRWEADLVTPL